jgi:transcriptional regulator with XRE-family HTH domain
MGANFAVKIKALCTYRKISQEDLGKKLGITQSAVSQILRAKGTSLSHAFALARFFNVSLDYLADPTIPVRSESELDMDERIRDMITRLGLDRAYNRLTLVEQVKLTSPVRPPGLPSDGVHEPEKPALEPTHEVHKMRRKTNQ